MLLGLPTHLAPQSSARAIARACHAIATVLLVAATVLLITLQFARPALILWPALIALVPMLLLLVLVERVRSTLTIVAYLVVGGASVYVYAITVLSQIASVDSSDAFTVSLPKLALILVGGSGLSARRGPLWATVGLVLGEVATQVASFQTGSAHRVDVAALLCFLLIVATMGGSLVARERASRLQPNLHRAAREEQVSVMRFEIEQQASALVHDTVLSHLAALSLSEPGRLDPELRGAMERDLQVLIGQEWLEQADSRDSAFDEWETSPLGMAVIRAEDQGLDVTVTGDVAALTRLTAERAKALALAVTQCFANVLRHSGTTEAELVILGAGPDVSIMVIDNGVGFTESETPRDRLGVRNSVRARIERVGGTVQIWSSPGSGTSVMIGLPADAQQADAQPADTQQADAQPADTQQTDAEDAA
ncbi:sensor histidine kinase [Frondihabitans sp. VKM Ac-2883]|uniref:sensor histidine kinase n=1 Tax=Frondihabitans sp. VKM Ac-2883 TaxID=2783823 RepID=UPI00188A0E8C|nr:ATP-binding protein [Frondihabitans sp. VKM Ac-2883]MBF4575969.1 ATP-binding protein [Frondihabitans sp. VKM Ac-2883]